MPDKSQSDGTPYDKLRDLLRSALPLSGDSKHLTRRRFFQAAMAAGAAALTLGGQARSQKLNDLGPCRQGGDKGDTQQHEAEVTHDRFSAT
jgi:hypothetical protein